MGNQKIEEYIVTHLTQALREGWIQVYYQPVVRTLSGKLCGMEALCRWLDPAFGMISPGVFIPVLEKTKLIPKLDAYVLDQVGQRLHNQMLARQPMVPISFNLSRLDFVLANPLAMVETVVHKYGLLRDYLCIEITETTIVQDVEAMTRQLERLHDNGYKIWLDDFGSGYSSLNVLHNYHFDELKLDMAFLQNFNEKGRKIIVSIVLMAKALGVHTLAEGVETEEQRQFLKEIGCEKIQGYYYSCPLPFNELSQLWRKRNLEIESRLEENLYDKAGLVNVITNEPVAIVRYNGQYPEYLMANEAFLKVLHSKGTDDLAQANRNFCSKTYPLGEMTRTFVKNTIRNQGREETIFFTENGQYMRNTARLIAGREDLCLLQFSLQNFTSKEQETASGELDRVFRKMSESYDGIVVLDLVKDQVRILGTVNEAIKHWETKLSIADFMNRYARIFVHPLDQKRYLSFIETHNLQEKALHSGRGFTSDLFRVKRNNGNYRWLVFSAMVSYKNPAKEIILGVREDLWEHKSQAERQAQLPALTSSFGLLHFPKIVSQAAADYGLLFYNLSQLSPLKLFWKDKQGRYIGASQAFLAFYGVTLKRIYGKTDREIGWDLSPALIENAENAVLQKGAIYRHILEQTIVQGQLRKIRIIWFPLYKGKNIVGSLGIVEELETEREVRYTQDVLGLQDPQTGYLSYRGGLEAGIRFMDAYQLRQEDFTAILIAVPGYDRIYCTFGAVVAGHLLQQVTRYFGILPLHQMTITHLGTCRFLLFTRITEREQILEYLSQLSQAVHNITQIDGYHCTLYLQYSLAKGSEVQQLDVLISLLIERLREAEQQQYGKFLYIGDRIAFDREKFDTMDEQVIITDPLTYETVYMNKSAQKSYRLETSQSYKGQKCYELLEGRKSPCPYCPNSFLRQDRFHTWTHRCVKNGQDLLLRDTLIPWRGRTLRFSMSLNLNQYVNMDLAENIQLYREASINDIIAIGMREEDASTGIQKMLNRLGEVLKAERCYLFEENPDGTTVSATYAWQQNGLASRQEKLQHLPLQDFQPLYHAFNQDQIALIPSVKEYQQKHPEFILPLLQADRFIAGHLILANHSQGFTAVINPSPDTFRTLGVLLATLTRFVSAMLRNRDKQNSLERFSRTDPLTGVGNRYGLKHYLEAITDGTVLTFIYGDINNLKKENDTYGHEAGDRLIQRAAAILSRHQDGGQVFRMGGDEFLLILENCAAAKAENIFKALQEDYHQENLGMALGMVTAAAPLPNLEEILAEADKKMYQDKKRGKVGQS